VLRFSRASFSLASRAERVVAFLGRATRQPPTRSCRQCQSTALYGVCQARTTTSSSLYAYSPKYPFNKRTDMDTQADALSAHVPITNSSARSCLLLTHAE
jgi:hypothetical protein